MMMAMWRNMLRNVMMIVFIYKLLCILFMNKTGMTMTTIHLKANTIIKKRMNTLPTMMTRDEVLIKPGKYLLNKVRF